MVMRAMRRNIGVLKWMFVVLLLVFGAGLVIQPGGGEQATAAAIVNGRTISTSEYTRRLDARLENLRSSLGATLDTAASRQARQEVMESLIEEELALEHAPDLGLQIDSAEFKQLVLNDPSFKDQQGAFDPSRYQEVLKQQAERGVSWQEAEDGFMRNLLLNKVRNLFSSQALLSPATIALAEARLDRQFRTDGLAWDLDTLARNLKIDEDALRDYYSRNRQRWQLTEQVKVRQILIRQDPTKLAENPRQKAEQAAAKIKAGSDFATLARELNSDEASRKNGGELGTLSRSDFQNALLADAAYALKPGQTSAVIETPQGFHLLKLESKRAGFEPTFTNTRTKALIDYSKEQARKEASSIAAKALARLREGATLEAVRKDLGGRFVSSAMVGRESESIVAGFSKQIGLGRAMAYLPKGQWLPQVYSNEKGVAVLRLADERPGAAPKKPELLDTRRKDAISQARYEKGALLYQEWVHGLRQKAKVVDQVGALATK